MTLKKIQIPSIPTFSPFSPNGDMSREAIQLQSTMADAMKKSKIFEETNKVMMSEKNKMVPQLREMEERNYFQLQNISELEKKIEITELDKKQEEETNLKLRDFFLEISERYKKEENPSENKEETIKKLMSELTELREKSIAESGSLRTRIFSQIGKTETLISEKSILENSVQDISAEHTSLTILVHDLQNQVFQLNSEKDNLMEKITQSEKKNRILDFRINPLEKKLREKESEILQTENRRTRKLEEISLRITKLEQEFRKISEERENLTGKLKNMEKNVNEKIYQIRKEDTETDRKFQNQIGTTESLTIQKWHATLQLGDEIKRNGILTKENSELRRTLLEMQQMVSDVAMDHHHPPLPRILSQPVESESEITEIPEIPENFPELSENSENPELSELSEIIEKKDNIFRQNENLDRGENGDVVMIRTGGLLASLPLVGRFWGWKTFHKKHEIIV